MVLLLEDLIESEKSSRGSLGSVSTVAVGTPSLSLGNSWSACENDDLTPSYGEEIHLGPTKSRVPF